MKNFIQNYPRKSLIIKSIVSKNAVSGLDVNENKMRNVLEQRDGENASGLIADLIIERQLQKIESRKKFKTDGAIDENEKW